jgi:hypothetical protein
VEVRSLKEHKTLSLNDPIVDAQSGNTTAYLTCGLSSGGAMKMFKNWNSSLI